MSRVLLLMRHGKAQRGPEFATDHERPLAERGRRDAPQIARLMVSQHVAPELIMSSSANRALATAQLIRQELGDVELQVSDAIYAASVDSLLSTVRSLPDSAQRVLLVGHNPGLEMLVDELAGCDGAELKTSSVAVLSLEVDQWSGVVPASAELKTIVHPRELQD